MRISKSISDTFNVSSHSLPINSLSVIYPNPMTNFTTIRILPRQLDLNEEEIQSIGIFTMLGVKVLELNSLRGTRVIIERGELN